MGDKSPKSKDKSKKQNAKKDASGKAAAAKKQVGTVPQSSLVKK